ncbi:MAG: O-antigen ligase family protein [Deltaproteobacteria bacterium]|nr:O-antigen ligase family protein [Deltaproteobacteria bacterium]
MDRRSSKVIGYCLAFLTVFPPLAFGGVYPWAYSLVELGSFSLLMVWLLGTRSRLHDPELHGERRPFSLPFALFVGLILFQMVPLPPVILKTLSPGTFALYGETLDGYGRGGGIASSSWGILNPGAGREKRSPGCKGDRDPRESEGQGESGLFGTARVFHGWRSLSIYGHATRTELLKVLAYAVVFLVVADWVDGVSRLSYLLRLIVGTGMGLSILGMVQRFLGVEKIYGIWEPLCREDLSFFGPFINPNHFAGYTAMVLPIALVMFLNSLGGGERDQAIPRSRYAGWLGKESYHGALFFLFALVVMVSALFLTLSRGGIVAFAGSTLFLATAISARRSWEWRLGLGLLTGLFAAVFVFWLGFVPFEATVRSFAHLFQEPNVHFRLQVWRDGWRMLRDFPIFGTGLGTFSHIYPRYKSIPAQVTVIYPESDFLQILVETGFLGIGLLIWFLVAYGRVLWRGREHEEEYEAPACSALVAGLTAAMVAMGIHGFGEFNLHIPANGMMFSMVLGLALAAGGKGWRGKTHEASR